MQIIFISDRTTIFCTYITGFSMFPSDPDSHFRSFGGGFGGSLFGGGG